MNAQAVIFDLDGTLLDTLSDLAAATNELLLRHDFPPHERDAYRYHVGGGARTLIARALPEHRRDDAFIDSLLPEFLEIYSACWDRESELYPGVSDLLTSLTQLKIPMAVLSNKPHAFTVQCAARFFSDVAFAAVVGQQDGVPHKPAPDGARSIARQLGCAPETVAFVGDTSVDIETALNAGMIPVGVLWGFRDAAELRSAGATALLESPMDVLSIFGSEG